MKHRTQYRVFRLDGQWAAKGPRTMDYWIVPRMARVANGGRHREYVVLGKTPFEAYYRCRTAMIKMGCHVQ